MNLQVIERAWGGVMPGQGMIRCGRECAFA